MTMRPFTDNRGGLNHLVDAQIGRAFPVVHKVYQHLDTIEYVAHVFDSGRARDIVIRTNHTKEWVEWQYKGEAKWTILFKFSDLLGADIADVVAAEQAIAAELEQLRAHIDQTHTDTLAASDRAQAAELGAVAAKDAAEVIAATAATYRDAAAQSAQQAAASSTSAKSAKDTAVSAKTAAEGFATAATTASTEAKSAKQAAESSAAAALTSKNQAGVSATAAAASAATATEKQSEVSTLHGAVVTASTTATAKAAEAAASASSASASATTATTKASQAVSSATTATNSATTATTKAGEAATSASAASNSAAAATTKAGEASASASSASASATTAATKANEASSAAASALASANSATAKASEAASSAASAASALNTKVDKVAGKQLSTEDFTSAEKAKLSGIASGAQVNTVTAVAGRTGSIDLTGADVGLSNVDNTSDANKPVSTAQQAALNGKENTGTAAAAVAAHTAASDPHPQYQVDLVSGTNIKTINGKSILGAGNIEIQGGAGPTLQGDTALYATQTKTYQVTNYNSFSSYAVAASAGTANISGDTITFTAPAAAGSVSLTITVDGQPTAFVIAVRAVSSYIPTPTPTPANFGDPLEGGFYAGMVWGQIAQSSTSAAIATGSKTFTVPSMTAAPIVYSGQTVEVRSRANPANKFVGTVTGAAGTNLTINVTSIGGNGTFSDWSVMARHRVIVAPKASGEHAGIALKNANTALPTACQTLAEGFAATQAMRDADTSTVYPAAHWVRNLAIGGRTDWYIPARDELELCWRNLKPTTAANYGGANRPAAASFSYANNGSYGDTANTHGTNDNSSPTGAAYTASVPGETAATAFRTGGAEAYEFGSALYWSSSDYIATSAWFQYWTSTNPGYQSTYGKIGALRVRAVRRSII